MSSEVEKTAVKAIASSNTSIKKRKIHGGGECVQSVEISQLLHPSQNLTPRYPPSGRSASAHAAAEAAAQAASLADAAASAAMAVQASANSALRSSGVHSAVVVVLLRSLLTLPHPPDSCHCPLRATVRRQR